MFVSRGSSVPIVWLENLLRDSQIQRGAIPIWFLVCF